MCEHKLHPQYVNFCWYGMAHDTTSAAGRVHSFMKKQFLVTPAKWQVKTDFQIKTVAMDCNTDSKKTLPFKGYTTS